MEHYCQCQSGEQIDAVWFRERCSDCNGLGRYNGNEVMELIPVFEEFYENEFHKVKEITKPTTLSVEIISYLKKRGYSVILATNPLFPPIAVKTRLSWIGLKPEECVMIGNNMVEDILPI